MQKWLCDERTVGWERQACNYRQSRWTFIISMTLQLTNGTDSPVGTVAGEVTWFPAPFTTPHIRQRILRSAPLTFISFPSITSRGQISGVEGGRGQEMRESYTCTTFITSMSCFSADITGPLGTISECMQMLSTSTAFRRGLVHINNQNLLEGCPTGDKGTIT
jgi:hypothetical protein